MARRALRDAVEQERQFAGHGGSFSTVHDALVTDNRWACSSPPGVEADFGAYHAACKPSSCAVAVPPSSLAVFAVALGVLGGIKSIWDSLLPHLYAATVAFYVRHAGRQAA